MTERPFPEHELYLLDNWTDAVELEASMDSVRETYKRILETVLTNAARQHTELDSQALHLSAEYSMNLGLGKSAWSKYPDWPTGIWLSDLLLENLTSEDSEHPSSWVYIAPAKNTLDLEEASRAVLKEAERLLPRGQNGEISIVTRKSEAWVAWSLPESRRELRDMLRDGEAKGFIDCLVSHFAVLAQFVPLLNIIFQAAERRRE
jgi:hypothetical protein